MVLLAIAVVFSGCPKTGTHGGVVEIDQHVQRLTSGVPYTPDRNGYFLSDDLLDKLLQRLEDLQRQLDSQPKAELYHDGWPDKGASAASMPADTCSKLFDISYKWKDDEKQSRRRLGPNLGISR